MDHFSIHSSEILTPNLSEAMLGADNCYCPDITDVCHLSTAGLDGLLTGLWTLTLVLYIFLVLLH